MSFSCPPFNRSDNPIGLLQAHRSSGDLQNTPLHAVVRWEHVGASLFPIWAALSSPSFALSKKDPQGQSNLRLDAGLPAIAEHKERRVWDGFVHIMSVSYEPLAPRCGLYVL